MAGYGFGGDEFVTPDIVKQFVVYLYHHIRERNIPEIQSMYEVSFLKLSDRYFKTTPWPPVEAIRDLVDGDQVFCLLYQEMYFRHLYARVTPDLRARVASWNNYRDLFGVIISHTTTMQLPSVWLWDMIDEFIYQYQSFALFRGKMAARSAEEVEALRKCDKVWSTLEVLNILQALVDKSGIAAELAGDAGARLFATDGFVAPGKSNVLRMLGYFSLVGLLRVHVLIGDYHGGLKALNPLSLFERTHLFTAKIVGAHIALFYYGAFAYMMLRRYQDAARCFNAVLSHLNRVKQYHQRSAQYDQVLKKNEQMYALLAITVALCPSAASALDDAVAGLLREKYSDKVSRMVRGDPASFDELFSYACPKFVAAAPPSLDGPAGNTSQDAYRTQLHLFLKEARSQQMLPLLKQYLLLYSSVSVPKLASLLEVEPALLRTNLTCLIHKSASLRWDGGADNTSGVLAAAGDLEFRIDVDVSTGTELVIVTELPAAKHRSDFLVRHVAKFQEIVRDLEMPPAVAPAAPAAPAVAVQ